MKKVNKLVIVGGGTAGWITASWFARRWRSLEVVVIDKSDPERVGESGNQAKGLVFSGLGHYDPQRVCRLRALGHIMKSPSYRVLEGVAPPTPWKGK